MTLLSFCVSVVTMTRVSSRDETSSRIATRSNPCRSFSRNEWQITRPVFKQTRGETLGPFIAEPLVDQTRKHRPLEKLARSLKNPSTYVQDLRRSRRHAFSIRSKGVRRSPRRPLLGTLGHPSRKIRAIARIECVNGPLGE